MVIIWTWCHQRNNFCFQVEVSFWLTDAARNQHLAWNRQQAPALWLWIMSTIWTFYKEQMHGFLLRCSRGVRLARERAEVSFPLIPKDGIPDEEFCVMLQVVHPGTENQKCPTRSLDRSRFRLYLIYTDLKEYSRQSQDFWVDRQDLGDICVQQ